jgi:lipocalin
MQLGVEFFVWSRPTDGFVWQNDKATSFWDEEVDPHTADERRFLVRRTANLAAYRTAPLQAEPTLYRAFADLEPTEEAFLSFANAHGPLGVTVLLESGIKKQKRADGKEVRTLSFQDPRAHGEPFWRWKQEHHYMRNITGVLKAIEQQDTVTLRKWFTVSDDGVKYSRKDASGFAFAVVCSPDRESKAWLWEWGMAARTESEQLLRFASGWAQRQINDALSGTGAGTRSQSLTSVRILADTDRNAMRIRIVPDTLLAAMWLQCARVLTEKVTFRACEHCGKWFEVSPDAKRRQSKYCSDRCKVAAYRARRAEGISVPNQPTRRSSQKTTARKPRYG